MAVKRPNILVYIAHDTGRHISPYGIKTVHTPNAERLAAEGTLFEQCFCTAPQCSPSRASAFTGRYPHSNGVMGLTHAEFAWDLAEGEVHLAKMLKGLGYDTYCTGSIHETRDAARHGFDVADKQYDALNIADSLGAWLDGRGEAGAPFYAELTSWQNHRPFPTEGCPPDDSLGVQVPGWLPDNEATRKDFAAQQGTIRQWDEGVGKLLDLLDERGIADDTLLIVTTDHGIAFARAKCTLYDSGIGVLLLTRWPNGGVQAGRRTDAMVSNVDFVPTILELLGQTVPANVQGVSFAELLTGADVRPREKIFAEMTFHGYYRPMRCVRTERYKYIRSFEIGYGVMVPTDAQEGASFTENIRYVRKQTHAKFEELYDVQADPDELNDLAGDSEHEAVRAELSAALAKWMRDTADPLLDGPVASPFYRKAIAGLGT